MHIHILGICGTFMGGIATLAKSCGHDVTGCDQNVYPPMSDQLQAQGIRLIEGFSADQTQLKPDLYVIGNVVTRGNPLMEAILNQGLPYISGPQWLADNILQGRWVMAVAGTHGKTTTTAMLTWILEFAQLDPGFLIGGIAENFQLSARLGSTPFFVIEADEYDTAFFDKRAKFVHYRPRTAILNNLEFDHADIYPNLSAIETQFHHLVRTIPGNGLVVLNATSEALQRVMARGCWSTVESFGTDRAWQAGAAQGDTFDVYDQGKTRGTVHWQLLGQHNRLNALAALLAARHVGVPIPVGIEALATFRNVKRRMEIFAQINRITCYNDFAHHPTAIAVTLSGLREKVGRQRILAVLEPRSNTMKMGVMKDQLAASLAEADQVFCYAANLGWDAQAALQTIAGKTHIHTDTDALVAALVQDARPDDHIVVMSNGSFDNLYQKLLTQLHDQHAITH